MSDSLDPHSIPDAVEIPLADNAVSPTVTVKAAAPTKSKKSAKPEIILPQSARGSQDNPQNQTDTDETISKRPKLLGKLSKKSDNSANSATPSYKPTPKTASRLTRTPVTAKTDDSIADWMEKEYRGVSIYAVLMGILLTLILWTGINTVRQIQAYHQQYTELQKTKKEYRKLQIERQRLLIEQQTFSATPQIARRAVTELNMFYPKLTDRLIIQMPVPASPIQNSAPSSAPSDEATP